MHTVSEMPTKTIIDWAEIVQLITTHGSVLIPLTVDYNTAHSAVHRHGFGCRKATNPEGVLVGWRIEPVKRRSAKEEA